MNPGLSQCLSCLAGSGDRLLQILLIFKGEHFEARNKEPGRLSSLKLCLLALRNPALPAVERRLTAALRGARSPHRGFRWVTRPPRRVSGRCLSAREVEFWGPRG